MDPNLSNTENLNENENENKNNDLEYSRKLASIRIVNKIQKIEKADRIELATVGGWDVVVQKDQFKVGDKIIYFEIDSLLPKEDWAAELKKSKYKVQSKLILNQISQGFILSLKILEGKIDKYESLDDGYDLTSLLKVDKFLDDGEIPENTKSTKSNKTKIKIKSFPTNLIPQTDEPRIQSETKYIDLFKGKPYFTTIKYDGTSGTYLIRKKDEKEKKDENDLYDFYICSRNNRRDYDPEDIYCKIADKYDIKNKLLSQDCKYGIQCEIYGPKIQNNLLNVNETKLAVFSIYDFVNKTFLDYDDFLKICEVLGLPSVKVEEVEDSFNYEINDLKKKSKGFYEGTTNHREGLIFRLQKNWYSDKRYSFKIINDDYLLSKKS